MAYKPLKYIDVFALNHALAAYATTITRAVSHDISCVKAHRAKSCPLHHAALESCVFLTLAQISLPLQQMYLREFAFY